MSSFQHLIKELSRKDGQLPLLLLNDKLSRFSKMYPEDKTLGGINRVISDVKGDFIKQSDLKTLYHKLHTFGTKFAQLFQEELGEIPAEPNVTLAPESQATEVGPYQVQDQILANALESVFDHHIPVKMYAKPVADKALKSVAYSLDAWNLRPSQLSVTEGNDKFIIVKANYETPKGITSFFVPVEVSKNEVVEPNIFVGNSGPEDLNHVTIKAYVRNQAGSKAKIAGTDLLKVLTKASSQHREISATELAMTRLQAERQGQSEFFQDQIVGLKVDAEARSDVQIQKLSEAYGFEKEFATSKGEATYKFGGAVDLGRKHLARELASFGFHTPQIVVTGHDDHTIFYGISLDTGKTSFIVPVKVANQQIIKPVVLLCNGSLTSFDREGINSLVSQNKNDIKVAAVASNFANLKPSEVLSNLRQAVTEGNFAKAEDALNVLAHAGDEKAHMTGFQIYMGMGDKPNKTECSKIVKSAVSEFPICSHTGLPVNKVYQDKQGFCRPMFRQGMAETYEGASFINAKIFG
jgi:hypothetical protein